MSGEAALKSNQLSKVDKRRSLIDTIEGSRTNELVLAFCGPVGSGVSTVAKTAEDILKDYGYAITTTTLNR